MVQIIPKNQPSFIESFFGGVNKGMERGHEFTKLADQARLQRQLQEEKSKLKLDEAQKKMDFITQIFSGKGNNRPQDIEGAQNPQQDQQNNLESGQPEGNQIQSQFDPINLSDQDIAMISTIDPNVARNLQHSKDVALRQSSEKQKLDLNREKFEFQKQESGEKTTKIPQQEYYKHAAKENSDFITDIGVIEKDLPNTSLALAGIEDSLGDANKWAAVKDLIADRTGFEGARSAAGAELDSFIKNYFLGDLTSIKGGRPNVFIEKQIRDAYQKAGRDPISNQKVLIGMKMKEEINKTLVEETRKLEKQYIDKEGFLPPNFKSKVRESIKDRVDKIEKKSIDTLHQMSKIEAQRDKIFRKHVKPGEVLMMSPEGQPFAVPKREVNDYKAKDYISLGEK